MKKQKYKTTPKNPRLMLVVAFALLLSGVVIVANLQNRQETRGRAAGSSAQTQCSTGKAQIAFSFTNTDTTRSVDLYVDDQQTKSYYPNQLTVGPSQTATGVVDLGQVAVSKGTAVFSYFWIDPNAPTNDPSAPSPTIAPTSDPNAPIPTVDAQEGGQLSTAYNAISCDPNVPVPTTAGENVVPSSTILGDCNSNGSCPTPVTTSSTSATPMLTPIPSDGNDHPEHHDFMGKLLDLVHKYYPNGSVQVNINTHKGPCFIATAAYGTPVAQDVRYLRAFRDEYLLTNGPGTLFVNFYYTVSPPIAQELSNHDEARALVRTALMPLISLSKWVVAPTMIDQYK